MTTADRELRRHLARLLTWGDAHVSFDDARVRVDGGRGARAVAAPQLV